MDLERLSYMDGLCQSRRVRDQHFVLTAAERLQPTLCFRPRVLAGVRD